MIVTRIIVAAWLRAKGAAPGVALCCGVALASFLLEGIERSRWEHPYVESLVFAILIGTIVRAVWKPSGIWRNGIAFCAKPLLEVSVMLLGASVSFASVMTYGLSLVFAIAAIVFISLGFSYWIGRALGLSPKLSLLIACGNSICGNSAIAAVAPVIEADASDIASAISFTAVLGVLVVLGLPLLVPLLNLSPTQFGILEGLTVYAVPQVLAATVPVSVLSMQVGTLVKLVRVLMLGPVIVLLSVVARRAEWNKDFCSNSNRSSFKLVPWFIFGFLALASLRSAGWIAAEFAHPLAMLSTYLAILSMAALGLGVDVRQLKRVGKRVTTAVFASLCLLVALSVATLALFG